MLMATRYPGVSPVEVGSLSHDFPGIPTTIKTMVVNITTIVYLRVLIIEIGSTIVLMVVEAQGFYKVLGPSQVVVSGFLNHQRRIKAQKLTEDAFFFHVKS